MHLFYSVSERLSKSKKLKTVRFFYPSTDTLLNIQALASCTTSVYVNLSKNSFFMPPAHDFERKRVQRYCFFPNHQNFSRKKFSFRTEKLQVLTNIKNRKHLHLIILYIENCISCSNNMSFITCEPRLCGERSLWL